MVNLAKYYIYFARYPPNTKDGRQCGSLLLLYNYFYHQYVGVLFALLAATFLSYRMFLGPSRTKKKRFQTSTPTGESCLCAVVSGCSSGIGLATVRELLTKTKLNVIGIDIARVHDLGVKSNRFSSFKCDVTNDKDLEKVFEYIQANSLIVDVICCCAGKTRTGPLMELHPDQIQKVMDINVMGVHRCIRSFFSRMRQGSIVVVILSEIAYALQANAFNAAYSMSKFALQAYVTALRQELELIGVTVKGIYPGAIETQLSKKDTIEMSRLHVAKTRTMYRNALMQFVKQSSSYINHYAKSPRCVADVVVNICLNHNTPDTLLVNSSNLMRFLKYVPQSLLDFGTSKMLRTVDGTDDTPNASSTQSERDIILDALQKGQMFGKVYKRMQECTENKQN